MVFLSLFATVAFTGCEDEEDDFVPQPTNYITFSPTSQNVPVNTQSLTLKADLKEFQGLEISNIDLYFIANSNEYTKRVAESEAFKREANASYFGNKLNVNYQGEKKSTDFTLPFDQYEITINVPLNVYRPVVKDFFYAGIELTYANGSKYRMTTRVDFVSNPE